MIMAIIRGGIVSDCTVFDDIITAQAFLTSGVWPGAEAVVKLADGYGIGDGYAGGVWSSTPKPQPIEPLPVEPINVDEYLLDLDYRLTMQEITGGGTTV